MATDNQLAANRRNAAKSTGPKTEAGKQRSSQNAFKHGCRANQMIVPGEDPEQLKALIEGYRNTYTPEDTTDEALVFHAALLDWRLMRHARAEAGLYWFRFNIADPMFSFPMKVAPETKEDKETYIMGRADQYLSGSEGHFTALSRYETSLRRAWEKAIQMLEQRRNMRIARRKAEAETAAAEAEAAARTIKAIPPQAEIQLKLPNEPVFIPTPIESTG